MTVFFPEDDPVDPRDPLRVLDVSVQLPRGYLDGDEYQIACSLTRRTTSVERRVAEDYDWPVPDFKISGDRLSLDMTITRFELSQVNDWLESVQERAKEREQVTSRERKRFDEWVTNTRLEIERG